MDNRTEVKFGRTPRQMITYIKFELCRAETLWLKAEIHVELVEFHLVESMLTTEGHSREKTNWPCDV